MADEWVTQMLRQSDSKVFKKYSQMQLQMKREALEKLDRRANERMPDPVTETARNRDSVYGSCYGFAQNRHCGVDAEN